MTPSRAALLVGLAGAALGITAVALSGGGAIVALAAAALGGALGLSRRYPTGAWVIAAAALLAAAPHGTGPFDLLGLASVFAAGRWSGRWSGAAAFLALVGAAELGVLADHSSAVPFVIVPAATWAAGRALRERELVATRLAERAEELDREREAYAQLSVRYERARIAGELHDIVAHALSVMVVQAGAGQRLAAVDPELTAETFEAISDAARQAEEDIARLVTLLSDANAIGAAPDLALLEELIGRASGSGLDVSLRLEGDRDGLPRLVTETAYRIVQESLTNALRYASGSAVQVLVRGDRDALTIDVLNGPRQSESSAAGSGTGNGLRGLRERIDACGGTLSAGPLPDGAWHVNAHLPRRLPARTA